MRNIRRSLLATTVLVGASAGAPAFGQDTIQGPPTPAVEEPVQSDTPAQAVDETASPTTAGAEVGPGEEIVVTGSRIARPNLTSSSPIAVVTGEETTEQGDITLDTYLNTLPQVNPAGTTTSNNPGNGGQSNVNLRGLGSNRNLVLVDGRRPMSSGTNLAVDLNTLPQGLIERIEVITGGAGAAYGADAIAGVVNIILKDDFQGLELRGSYANSMPQFDNREYQVSGLLGANFDDARGNVAISAEYSKRESLGKLDREFSQQASSTTGTPPTGRLSLAASAFNPAGVPGAGARFQQRVNEVFAQYGVAAGSAPLNPSRIGFNTDGTLFGTGVFNTPEDVVNYQYDPLGLDPAAANQNFFPDFYSYNFDLTNLLVLPLQRKSVFVRGNYEIDPAAEVFIQGGLTQYTSQQGLAATPVGVRVENPECSTTQTRATSPLVECGQAPVGLVVPVTNPYIPADLAAILAAREGNNPALVGSGATEPFQISKRFLDTGLRISTFDNEVLQGLVGLRGDITDRWRYETSYSWGRTIIDSAASGNVNVQNAQALVEAPDGGEELCEGGFNPFGTNPISADCVEFLNETGFTSTTFTQKVLQGYITGELADLPAGPLSVVIGAERRKWDFEFDPGTLFGPIAGFNTADPAAGRTKFTDIFGELNIPIAKDQPWAQSAEVNLTYRRSKSEFVDAIPDDPDEAEGGSTDDAYGITGTWEPIDRLRLRGSYQHSVRAPNFVELFAGGGSFPQYFDPCSITTNFRQSGGQAATDLCVETGLSSPNTYVQTPGSQAFIGVTGNPNLGPETGDTWTVGGVFQRWGFTGSVDYYNIRIKDSIFAPDPNMIIAACYGYHGINPDLDFASPYCSGDLDENPATDPTSIFARVPTISYISIPVALGGDENGYFQAVNQGKIKTSGIDVQLGYSLPTDFVAPASRLSANLLLNYLIDFKVEELPGVMIDYAGTVSYFGAGLGTSFPRWRGNLNLAWNMKPFTLESRIRYIHKMDNRITVQFPGEESQVTGTDSVWYFDFAAQAEIRQLTLRAGLNNAFNRRPPEYSPNVQSGTDPSLFDVIGRRAFVSAILRY